MRELREQSSHYVDGSALHSLETFAERMRGEIFFFQSWMLVEGQADYLIVHAMGTATDFDLGEHGVSVIDVQNNGRADTFAVLARALGIPWHAVFDDDKEGRKYINSIRGRGFEESEIKLRCDTHPAGDLEKQVLADGLGPEVRDALDRLGVRNAGGVGDEEVLQQLSKNKTSYAAILASMIADCPGLLERCPATFRAAIRKLEEGS